jgi:hypothetical protein
LPTLASLDDIYFPFSLAKIFIVTDLVSLILASFKLSVVLLCGF